MTIVTLNNTPIAIGQPFEIRKEDIVDVVITENDAASTAFFTAKSSASDDNASQDLDYDEPCRERALAMRAQGQRIIEEAEAELDAADEADHQGIFMADEIINEEITEENKFSVVVLPCQSGKTSQVLTCISLIEKDDALKGASLHLVFTMNDLINCSQFSGRITDRDRSEIRGNVTIVSSKAKTKGNNTTHSEMTSLQDMQEHMIVDGDVTDSERVNTVVMCTNGARIMETKKLLQNILRTQPEYRFFKRVFLYFDELHDTIMVNGTAAAKNPAELTTMGLIDFAKKLPFVHKVVGITATPNEIFEHVHDVPQSVYKEPNLENYEKLDQLIWKYDESSDDESDNVYE